MSELNERSREIFRRIVENYMQSGEPVGSRTLSRQLDEKISPATIRNVMADLQATGLLYAPHTSSGRLPTDIGLRLYVNGLLELGTLTEEERLEIDRHCAATGRSTAELLEEATETLSGLAHCAGLVLAPKMECALKHVEFVHLGLGRVLVVMVAENGLVENRLINVPLGMIPSTLVEAGNFLNARLAGRTLAEARGDILWEIKQHRADLDDLTRRVIEAGIATRSGEENNGYLIVRGQANLLDDVTAIEDLERIRAILSALETREGLIRLLDSTEQSEGVQIFIGSETKLFGLAGCSMIVAPFHNDCRRIIGAIGVVGPTRINYTRIIPMVDYTAKLVGRLIG